MAEVTPDDVRSIARLSRLELTAREVDSLTGEMNAILEYVATLQELDTEGVEPTAHATPRSTPLRLDEPVESLDTQLSLGQAPRRRGTEFVVPKVV